MIACSDSRVPVEILFDQGIGDVFVVRVPGNVCNGDEIAGIEYGVEHLDTPLCNAIVHFVHLVHYVHGTHVYSAGANGAGREE